MQEILDQLTSPVFWFSVIIVGIIVSIIGNRSDRLLDRLLSSVSTRWNERSEKAKAESLARVKVLRDREKARQRRLVVIIWYGFVGLAFMIFGLAISIVGLASGTQFWTFLGVGITYVGTGTIVARMPAIRELLVALSDESPGEEEP